MIPSLVLAMCQGEADVATATMSCNPIRGPAMVALMFTSGPKYDDRRRGCNMVQLDVKQHPQLGTLFSSQTPQNAMHACSACRYTCRRLHSDACVHLRSIRP